MAQINVNGKVQEAEEAHPAIADTLQTGIGLFETILYQQEMLYGLPEHFQRLSLGLATLGLELPGFGENEMKTAIEQTIEANHFIYDTVRIRLTVYPQHAAYFSTGRVRAFYIIQAAVHKVQDYTHGIPIGFSACSRKNPDPISHLKTIHCTPYYLASREAATRRLADLLLLNNQGSVVESTIANVFWKEKGQLFTPPLSDGCIAGIMRRKIMEQYPVTEKSITPEALKRTDAVFLTNSLRGIMPVAELDGQSLPVYSSFL